MKFGRSFYVSALPTYIIYEKNKNIPTHIDTDGTDLQWKSMIIYLNNFDTGHTYICGKDETKEKIYSEQGDVYVFDGKKIKHGCFDVSPIKKIIVGQCVFD